MGNQPISNLTSKIAYAVLEANRKALEVQRELAEANLRAVTVLTGSVGDTRENFEQHSRYEIQLRAMLDHVAPALDKEIETAFAAWIKDGKPDFPRGYVITYHDGQGKESKIHGPLRAIIQPLAEDPHFYFRSNAPFFAILNRWLSDRYHGTIVVEDHDDNRRALYGLVIRWIWLPA
jgi:hypothetical protein